MKIRNQSFSAIVELHNSKLVFFLCIFFAQISLFAADSETLIICKNQKNVRTMTVKSFDGQFYVAEYTRNSLKQEVARAKQKSVCLEVVSNIKVNLQKAGWVCKEVLDTTETVLNADHGPMTESTSKK